MLRQSTTIGKNLGTANRVSLPPKLYRVWLLIVGISLASLLFCIVTYRLHLDPSYYRILSVPGQRLGDFRIYQQIFQLYFHTAAFFHQPFPFTYPAPVALVFEFFFHYVPAPLETFFLFSVLAVVIPTVLFGFALRRRGISPIVAFSFAATLLICSWPALLVIDRGNMEIVVWIALATATWALATGRTYVAAGFFGLAAAFKLFPFVYLALFFSTRRWKELFIGIITFAGVSIFSLFLVGPSFSIAAHGIASGLHFFQKLYMQHWRSYENGVDHSLFAAIKFLMIVVFHHPKEEAFTWSLSIYTISTVVLGAAVYIFRIRFLPLLNQLLLLSIASIYFTAFSGDGTLLHLYYAFALLQFLAIDAWRKNIEVPGLGTALYLLAFLQSYEAFFSIYQHRLEGEVKCVALGWLFLVALQFPFGPLLNSRAAASNLAEADASAIDLRRSNVI